MDDAKNEEQYQEAEQATAGLLAFVCSLLPEEALPANRDQGKK